MNDKAIAPEFKKNIRIETDRFFMRVLTPDDASQEYSSWLDEDQSRRYIKAAQSPHDVSDLYQYIQSKYMASDCLFLGIFTKGNGQHIGNIKFEPINYQESYAIMGILIGARDWRGKGVAQEILRHTCNWLASTLGITKIVLGVSKDNSAAIKAYENAGFIASFCRELTSHSDTAITMVKQL